MPDTDSSQYAALIEQRDDVLFTRLSPRIRQMMPPDALQIAAAQASDFSAPSVGFANRKRIDPAAVAQVMSNLSQPDQGARPLWNELGPHLDQWSREVTRWQGERRPSKGSDS